MQKGNEKYNLFLLLFRKSYVFIWESVPLSFLNLRPTQINPHHHYQKSRICTLLSDPYRNLLSFFLVFGDLLVFMYGILMFSSFDT